ncbi:MAG: hypothetical protein GY928_25710, partial [Colwellia sp.]|nr:hypothetical protein [Colwellia sp.]
MPEGTNALGTIGLSALMADLTKTLDGSMEKVGPVFKNMVSLSGKVYDMAFEMNLQEVIYQASQRDGMEDFVTILSADQVEAAAPTAMKMLMELQEKLHQQAQEEENVRAREDGRRPQEIDFKGNLMAAFAGIAKMNEIENDEKLMAGRISIKKDAPEPVNNEARNIIPIKTPEGEIVYMQILN